MSRSFYPDFLPLSALRGPYPPLVLVYVVRDLTASPDDPLGDAVDVFLRQEDAVRFLGDVNADEPRAVRLVAAASVAYRH